MQKLEELIGQLLNNEAYQMKVRKAGVFRFPIHYRYQPHRHVEYEINYVSSGNCVMHFGEEYVPLRQGACIIIPPYYEHGFIVDLKGGCKITQVEMQIDMPKDSVEPFTYCNGEQPYYVIHNCEDVVTFIEQIAKLYRHEWKNSYTELQLRLAMLQLLIALGHHTDKLDQQLNSIQNEKILWVLNFIHAHYDENIQIEAIAKQAGMSSRYLRKYFAEVVGMSCIEYITILRINKAKELFWETNKNVTEVAMAVGYGSSQYFCRVFRKQVGLTPKEYKTSWKEEQVL